jgi:hypothetical protein
MVNFGEPLLTYVLKGGGGGDGEADEEDIGLGIGKGSETIVIFLSGSIEEAKGVWFIANPVVTLGLASGNLMVCKGGRGGVEVVD